MCGMSLAGQTFMLDLRQKGKTSGGSLHLTGNSALTGRTGSSAAAMTGGARQKEQTMKLCLVFVAGRIPGVRRLTAACLFAAALVAPAAGALAGTLTFTGPPNLSHFALYEDYNLVHSWEPHSIFDVGLGATIQSTTDDGANWNSPWGPSQTEGYEWTVQNEVYDAAYRWRCTATYYNSEAGTYHSDVAYVGTYYTP